jgi:hypothetical protein
MKTYIHTLTTFLLALAFMACIISPVSADTRSATIKISFTILPMLEMASPAILATSPQSQGIELRSDSLTPRVQSNQGANYQVIESLVAGPSSVIHLYSVTAL